MLLKVKDHLQLVGAATLTDLARKFDVPESVMQGMMEQWIRKGRVLMKNEGITCDSGSCGGCTQSGCAANYIKYYWLEK